MKELRIYVFIADVDMQLGVVEAACDNGKTVCTCIFCSNIIEPSATSNGSS